MSDTPQLLALMQKTREMRAYDCVKEFESLARKLEKENIALKEQLDAARAENAALRAERVLVSVHTGKFTTISGLAMICPDCGRALLHEDRAAIDAAGKESKS